MKKAFTFVELIIVVTIIAILWTIWMVSYTSYLSDSRDSKRISDFWLIKSALKSYFLKRWSYSTPWNNVEIQYSWSLVAYQWKLDKNVLLSDLDSLPSDPKNKLNYFYSITKNKQEFQIAWTLENWDNPKALLDWNYKTVSKNILPTLILATWATSPIEVQSWTTAWDINRKLFVYNENIHNLVYDFDTNLPYSDWTDFDTLLQEAENSNNFWQNSDYRDCLEIKEAWKLLIDPTNTPIEYQINENGSLTNTWCTISNTQ